MSDKLTIKGTVLEVRETNQVTANMRKRELIVKENKDSYPQEFCIEFVNDKEELLDMVEEGETVEVSVNLRSRRWTSPSGEVKHFSSLQGWKVETK